MSATVFEADPTARISRPVVQLGLTAFGLIAHYLEQHPEEAARRIGITICPACGDVHPVNEVCERLCSVLGGPENE